MDKIHIIYGTDDNYILPTEVSAASAVFYAANKSNLVMHLFDAGVTDEHYEHFVQTLKRIGEGVEVIRHKLSGEMFEGFGAWRGSVVTYSRMFMADILPEVDWAIYIDGDTLWLGDPQLLWDMRNESKLVIASKDPPTTTGVVNPEFEWYRQKGLEIDSSGYLCMGLMLANLKKMREEGIPGKCREFMSRFPNPRIVDQTVLNYVCQGKTAPLPPNWGVFSVWHGLVDLSEPSIVHYCQDLPFNRNKLNRLMSDVCMVWFEFCKRVLGRDESVRVPFASRVWRRLAYNVLRHLQPLVKANRYVHSRLRNTHGMPRHQYKKILASFG